MSKIAWPRIRILPEGVLSLVFNDFGEPDFIPGWALALMILPPFLVFLILFIFLG